MATRGTLTRTGNTALPFRVTGVVKPECCTCSQGRLRNKIAGTKLQNIHQFELFATCCRSWGCLATRATAFDFFADQLRVVEADLVKIEIDCYHC